MANPEVPYAEAALAAVKDQSLSPQAVADEVVAAVVIITFNRPVYLQKHLESVLSVHGRHPEHRSASSCTVVPTVGARRWMNRGNSSS